VIREGRSIPCSEIMARLPIAKLRPIFMYAQERTWAISALERREESVGRARPIMKQPVVREQLCPSLIRVTDDVYDIAKVALPVLVPLAIAGTIVVPLTPILVAGGATLVARMGVAWLCHDQKKA